MRKVIFCIQVLFQCCGDVNKCVYVGFIDYRIAFDTILQVKVLGIFLKPDIGVKDSVLSL